MRLVMQGLIILKRGGRVMAAATIQFNTTVSMVIVQP